MDGLTPEQAFQARELSASGVWSGRIAELLGVDDRLLRLALDGRTGDELAQDEVQVPEPASEPARVVPEQRADPNGWPPPADERTVWSTLRMPKNSPLGDDVQVRTVRLWGRDVQVDERGLVWCPACHRFRSVEALGTRGNSCPVGVIWPSGGVHWFDGDAPDPEPRYVTDDRAGRGDLNFFRARW